MKFIKKFIIFLTVKIKTLLNKGSKNQIKKTYIQLSYIRKTISILGIALALFILLTYIFATMLMFLISSGIIILLIIAFAAYLYKRRSLRTLKEIKELIIEYNKLVDKYHYHYNGSIKDLPSYLIIGADNDGKNTLLANKELQLFTNRSGSTQLNWYFNDKILIWNPRNIASTEKRDETETAPDSTDKFIKFLNYQGHFPVIDGLILTISAEELISLDAKEIRLKAEQLSKTIYHIKYKLSHSFPVYIVVTKCDLICGFINYFENIRQESSNNTLGWINSYTNIGTKFSADSFKREMYKIISRVKSDRLSLINKLFANSNTSKSSEFNTIFALPENLIKVTEKLTAFTNHILVSSELKYLNRKNLNSIPLFLRGVFFTSSKLDTGFFDTVSVEQNIPVKTIYKYKTYDTSTSYNKKAAFTLGIFKHFLYREKMFVVYLISKNWKFKIKRLCSWCSLAAILACIFIFSWSYWANILNMITLETKNPTYLTPEFNETTLMYPGKTLEFLKAKRHYYYFEYSYKEILETINNPYSNGKLSAKLEEIIINMPYSQLINTKISQKFNPETLDYITGKLSDVESRLNSLNKIRESDTTETLHNKAIDAYRYYMNDYLAYWQNIINNSYPVTTDWEQISKAGVQYWQINSSYSKCMDIIKSALNDYKKSLIASKTFENPQKNTDRLISKTELLLKDISQTEESLKNINFREKTTACYSFWQNLLLNKTSIDARNKLLDMKNSDFLNSAVVLYTRNDEQTDFYKKYWHNLTYTLIESLGNSIEAAAADYIRKLQDNDEFPLYVKDAERKSITGRELENILKGLNNLWPPKANYPEDTIGYDSNTKSTRLNKLISVLRPELAYKKMQWVKNVKELFKKLDRGVSAKVYLMGSETYPEEKNAAQKWIFMSLNQKKSDNIPVRTRDTQNQYLGDISSSEKSINFEFFKTNKSAESDKDDQTLRISGKWPLLRLLLNGPDRPQYFRDKYWLSWKMVKKLNDRDYLTRLTFSDKDNHKIYFLLKLKFSENVDSILKI